MEPLVAVGLAGNILQITSSAVHISKRIAYCFGLLQEIPEEIEYLLGLVTKLQLINDDIKAIDEQLTDGEADDQSRLKFKSYVLAVQSRAKRLDSRVVRYLPEEDASLTRNVLQALRRLAADDTTRRLWDELRDDHQTLKDLQLTSIHSSISKLVNWQQRGTTLQPGQTYFELGRFGVQNFVERPILFSQIRQGLEEPNQRRPVVVLQGMGGQGKTQLAIAYCHDAKGRQRYGATFWIDAAHESSVTMGMEQIAERIKKDGQVFADSASKIDFVKRSLSDWPRPWLLVFDNYDNPASFELSRFLPGNMDSRSGILITSRSLDTSRYGRVLSVPGMLKAEAVSLLYHQASMEETDENRHHAEAIVQRLGYLPLAIDQAGTYIAFKGIPLEDFMGQYERSAQEILDYIPPGWEYQGYVQSPDGGTATEMAKTAFATWSMSLSLLNPGSESGAMKSTILSLIAYFDEKDISEELFSVFHTATRGTEHYPKWMTLFVTDTHAWSNDKFRDLMHEFFRLSLVTSKRFQDDQDGTRYVHVALHPLVRDWIKLRPNPQARLEAMKIASQILSTSMMQTYRERQCPTDFRFRQATARRDEYLSHLFSWWTEFQARKNDIQPTLLFGRHNGSVRVVEQVFAHFFQESSILRNAITIYEWLWDMCDPQVPDFLPVKWSAGNCLTVVLPSLGEFSTALTTATKAMTYWQQFFANSSEHDGDNQNIVNQAISHWITVMGFTYSREDLSSAIDAARGLVEQFDPAAHGSELHHQFMADLCNAADGYTSRYGGERSNRIIAQQMVSDTERMGSAARRREIWSPVVWTVVLDSFPDSDEIKARLVDEFLATIEEDYGPNHASTWEARLSKAYFLERHGNHYEAYKMASVCVEQKIKAPSAPDSTKSRALRLFGKLCADPELRDLDTALWAFKMAIDSIDAAVMPAHAAEIFILCAKCEFALGKLTDVEVHLHEAFKILDTCDMTILWRVCNLWNMARLRQEMGQQLDDRGSTILSLGHLEPLLDIFRERFRETVTNVSSEISSEDDGFLRLQLWEVWGFNVMMCYARVQAVLNNIVASDAAFHQATRVFESEERDAKDARFFIHMALHCVLERSKHNPDSPWALQFRDWAMEQFPRRVGEAGPTDRTPTWCPDDMTRLGELIHVHDPAPAAFMTPADGRQLTIAPERWLDKKKTAVRQYLPRLSSRLRTKSPHKDSSSNGIQLSRLAFRKSPGKPTLDHLETPAPLSS